MPRTVAELDARRYGPGWDEWPVPTMPALDRVPWGHDETVFWRRTAHDRPVSATRSALLADVDVPVTASAGNRPWQGTTYGVPYQVIAAHQSTTLVWSLAQAPTWSWSWTRGLHRSDPVERVPLPDRVRRGGDPAGAFDRHWFGWDPNRRVLWEAISLERSWWNRLKTWGRTEWTCGYQGGGPGIARWDTSKPWDALGQPRGVVAANFPKLPLVARWDEVTAGGIGHALFLVMPNYAPDMVGPARGTDGTIVGHPVRAGEWLRLRPEVAERFPAGTAARAIADGLVEHGACNGDKNSYSTDPTDGRARLSLSMDRRWATGDGRIVGLDDVPFEVRLSDFEILTQEAP